jgi:hypothetical protein
MTIKFDCCVPFERHWFIYGHCDVISKYIVHKVAVKNGRRIIFHNKRGEQAYYTKYSGK